MNDIRLFQLASMVKPEPVENKQKNWVLYGVKNSFYQYIIDMNDDSSTNGSVNKSYADYIFGKGLTATNASTNVQDWARLKSILSEKELRKICTDLQIFTEASLQVIKTKGGDLSTIEHLPKNFVVPALENEDGEIDTYWYSRGWNNTYKNPPESFPAFGTSKEPVEIYCIKPYSVGSQYFTTLDYNGGLIYAEMEREIANQNISYIKNSLSAGYIVSIPDGKSLSDEEKDRLERKIKQKLAGSSNAGSFILEFLGRDAGAITVTVFPVPDNIHKQYDSFDERAIQKILTAHRCTSPSIVGIISSSGFSNTAEEMEQARVDLLKYIIKPKQKLITNALEEILVQYGINLDLEFIPLTAPKEVPTELSSHVCLNEPNEELDHLLERYAEDAPEGFELHSSELVGLSAIQKSEQDTDLWKVRYAYVGGTNKVPKSGSRPFCLKMRALEMAGKVFRKEDILQMEKDGVNSEFGHNKAAYSIWLYAGGVNCYHRWERRIFKKKEQPDGELYKGNPMQNVNPVNVKEAQRQGWKHKGIPNEADVAIAEITKPNKGKYPG